MLQYGIYDKNDNLVGEFESLEEGLLELKEIGDGEITPYRCGGEGYFTDHYYLERGLCSRVCQGQTNLRFQDGAPVAPISAEDLGVILSSVPTDTVQECLVTLDFERANRFFDTLEPASIIWNAEDRTMIVDFYFLETEDSLDGDVVLFYKCSPFHGGT